MVHVQMRDDDVPHVISREAEAVELVRDGFVMAEDWPGHTAGGSYPPRVVAVMGAKPAVHQHKSVFGFNQQHVADHRTRPLHRATVQVVHLHVSRQVTRRDASSSSTSRRAAPRST